MSNPADRELKVSAITHRAVREMVNLSKPSTDAPLSGEGKVRGSDFSLYTEDDSR